MDDLVLDEPGLELPHPAPARARVRARAARRARSGRSSSPVAARCGSSSSHYNPHHESSRRARRVRGQARARAEARVHGGLRPLPLLHPDPGRDVSLQPARSQGRAAGELPVLPSPDGGRLGLGQEPADADDPARRGVHVGRPHRRGAARRGRRAQAHGGGARRADRRAAAGRRRHARSGAATGRRGARVAYNLRDAARCRCRQHPDRARSLRRRAADGGLARRDGAHADGRRARGAARRHARPRRRRRHLPLLDRADADPRVGAPRAPLGARRRSSSSAPASRRASRSATTTRARSAPTGSSTRSPPRSATARP